MPTESSKEGTIVMLPLDMVSLNYETQVRAAVNEATVTRLFF